MARTATTKTANAANAANVAPQPDFLVLTSPGVLGPLVHSARQAKGLTRPQVAAMSGTGLRFIYDLERGKPTLRMDLVLRVMAALELVAIVVDSKIAEMAEAARRS